MTKENFIQEYLYIEEHIPSQKDIEEFKKRNEKDEDKPQRGVIVIDLFD